MSSAQTQSPGLGLAWNPVKKLREAAVVVIIAFVWGMWIPGLISYAGGVFYNKDLEPRLPKSARTKLKTYQDRRENLISRIKKIDISLLHLESARGNPRSVQELTTLVTQRSQLKQELDSLKKPPVILSGFYLSPTMLLWPVAYTALGLLIFIFPPPPSPEPLSRKVRQVALISLVIILMYRWPTWARNFLFYGEGRVIYSDTNFDIYPVGFFMQEALGFTLSVLLACLWYQWSTFFRLRQQALAAELSAPAGDHLKVAIDQASTHRLSATFIHWQVCSVILALGFAVWTWFYWDAVVASGDQRYLVHAVIVHALWAISWVLLSLPLLVTWYVWQSNRLQAIAAVVTGPLPPDTKPEAVLKALSELQPIGFWNLAASTIIAAISFLLPILQALAK
jgi:hypothetical protein